MKIDALDKNRRFNDPNVFSQKEFGVLAPIFE
jgi:hypothetical protein